ncbi:MAG: TM0106 family RecB-like putative nuclease [Chthoniobacteraceae bacterium]
MKITPAVFEAYLKCPTKCRVRATGEAPSGNTYAEWVQAQNASYRETGTARLIAASPHDEVALSPDMESVKTATWRLASSLAVHAEMDSCALESELHAVERVPAGGRGKAAQFIPIRFVFTNKLGKDDKLLLALDAVALSKALKREVSLGKIIHRDNHATLKVKTSALAGEVRKRLENIAALLANPVPPDLVLNRHCGECEFQARCRRIAVEKDDLSLLARMTEKERKEYRSKGIFTVTQLSYTFRPRRRPKKLRDKREKYHHSLKALAIREKKIHIVGTPELKIEGTPVYLDVEGLPDRDFYYLIGLRIGHGDSAVQHSLWADTVADEGKIWREFLAILETVEKPVLIHYGSYETNFSKQMAERHGGPAADSGAAKAIASALNLVSVMFGKIYFPTYSNGLKDIAGWLGFQWKENSPSGLRSICWRHEWGQTTRSFSKETLFTYNSNDCAALEAVACAFLQACLRPPRSTIDGRPTLEIAHADALSARETLWPKFTSTIDTFESINMAARWDYQRNRIYLRTDRELKRTTTATTLPKKRAERINKDVRHEIVKVCPECLKKTGRCSKRKTRTLYDIRFTQFGIRRWVVRYHFGTYWCRACHRCFGRPIEFWQDGKYGRNLFAFVLFQVIELCMSQQAVGHSINRLFRLGLNQCVISNFKFRGARLYNETRQRILAQMLKGNLIHADETRFLIKGNPSYVWVFATFREVVYFYSETREGDLLTKLLTEFKGVLVSDFYAVYDSMPCLQQKCLIHLMRDLNDTVLDYPFDEEVRGIVTQFGEILRNIVATIDRRGLKGHFLQKHRLEVERFYRHMRGANYQSEAALRCKERFEKNKEKLFTFLNHDGVPWNNNNVEHAIKAFARLRRAVEGLSTPKGIEEYLILLSVCQTCKYMGVDFLDFLRSGEKDVHAFAESRRGRRCRPSINEPTALAADEILGD